MSIGSHSPGHSSLNSIDSITISTHGNSLEKVIIIIIIIIIILYLGIVINENLSWNDHIEHIWLVI